MEDKNRKIITLLTIFTIIFTVIGSSLAYWRWQTASGEETSVTFTVASEFSCSADGGDISNGSQMLAPTSCDNATYAIKRELTLTPRININDKTIYMDLWLDIKSLDSGLENNENFKWVLSNSASSCTGDAIENKGTFESVVENGQIILLDAESFTKATQNVEPYYLYIWLDSAETSPDTYNQNFEFKLNGECYDEIESYPEFTYVPLDSSVSVEDSYDYVQGEEGNWELAILSSGNLNFSNINTDIDIFLVGGGGGGGGGWFNTSNYYRGGGGGGAGGYITTKTGVSVEKNIPYYIQIGTGGAGGVGHSTNGGTGGNTTAFDQNAAGGTGGNSALEFKGETQTGGTGEGGAGGANSSGYTNFAGATGGNGKYAFDSSISLYQSGIMYGAGGGGGSNYYTTDGGGAAGGITGGGAGGNMNSNVAGSGQVNTGAGGGGGSALGSGGGPVNSGGAGGTGGSGIVIIRNAR